jgi:hypothetical protein
VLKLATPFLFALLSSFSALASEVPVDRFREVEKEFATKPFEQKFKCSSPSGSSVASIRSLIIRSKQPALEISRSSDVAISAELSGIITTQGKKTQRLNGPYAVPGRSKPSTPNNEVQFQLESPTDTQVIRRLSINEGGNAELEIGTGSAKGIYRTVCFER